jgi:predicted nucleic acid-binding protein
MIVVDASALVELLLMRQFAAHISARLFRSDQSLHAPELIDAEVAHTLRRYWLAGTLSAERGSYALAMLRDMPILRYSHEGLLDRVWTLRENVTAYDACYIALAEYLNAPLITRDARLARSSGHDATIELIA